ncbi:MAG: DUF5717 family protein [Lachnospiraceae bacterium]|nr:DUF5717 family protein [Lachnospiraceae bacterium]
MHKNVENLVKGEFFSVKINILADVSDLSCDLFSNRKYEDSLTIYNDKDHEMLGHIYSTNHRVRVNNEEIKGKNHKLSFYIDTVNVEDKTCIEGEFQIITDVGELIIPYKYEVSDDEDTKTIKSLNTIEDYHNLVITNVNLSLAIFDSKRIYKCKMMLDEKVLTYYETFKKGSSKYISFIEFFASCGYDVKSYLIDIEDPVLDKYLHSEDKKDMIDTTDTAVTNENEKIYESFIFWLYYQQPLQSYT